MYGRHLESILSLCVVYVIVVGVTIFVSIQ